MVGELKARLNARIVHAIDALDAAYIESGKFRYSEDPPGAAK